MTVPYTNGVPAERGRSRLRLRWHWQIVGKISSVLRYHQKHLQWINTYDIAPCAVHPLNYAHDPRFFICCLD